MSGEHAESPLDEVRKLAERRLTPEEFEDYVHAPLSDAERAEQEALITWFLRRYPTPLERLRYARRAYRRWRAAMP